MFETAETIGALLLAAMLVASFSGGIAFWLIKTRRAGSRVRVSTVSAVAASCILSLIPVVATATQLGLGGEFWIVLVVMVVTALFLAAVIGFPAALYVAKKAGHSSAGTDAE